MKHLPLLFLPLLAVAALAAADPTLAIDLKTVESSGDPPMIVMWVEKADGTFVKSLQMFSKDRKYYPDMLTWSTAREGHEDKPALDAVVGATVKWGQARQVRIPVVAGGVNLLAGDLVLRIEQRKDKGGHYRKRRIPLPADWPGVTLEQEGYIAKLTITVEH
jgi:hypothetical protein